MANTAAVIAQLRLLAQLTRAEIQVARTREAQARTEAVRRELRQNGDNAVRRAERIAGALGDLDAVPDVVGPVFGRVMVLAKTPFEQAQPLSEALLGDLGLEHQLLDRARYLVALTDREGPASVHRLAEQLVTAHTATVEWLSTVLAENALGGPTALRPTPLQVLAGGATQVLRLPGRVVVRGVNETGHRAARAGQDVVDRVVEFARRVERLGGDTREVVATGVDSALARAEVLTRRDGSPEAVKAVHSTRRELGALTEGELPVRGYDRLSVQDAVTAVKKLDGPDEVQAIIRYEEKHKNRSGVVSAAQTRHADIAKTAIGVS